MFAHARKRKKGTRTRLMQYIIKKKSLREKLKESVTRPFPSYSSHTCRRSALPEALDDSEKWSRLALGSVHTEDEGLASSEELAASNLAFGALESESDLLGLLCLLSEDGLGLTTEP